jgi:outer membrane receptor protein involved in Fe transport
MPSFQPPLSPSYTPARLRLLALGCFAAHAGLFAPPCAAQSALAPTTSAVDTASHMVEVVAERLDNSFDRQVYDIKSNLNTPNYTVANALNNIPSVSVDPDGSVRLREEQNVTILVDGKPLALLQGENRSAALNAIPADFFESIEVINNPGAEFGNEGRGGAILNLVSRRNRKPDGFIAGTANVGSAGRYNGGISGSYKNGYAAIDNSLNYRYDIRNSTSTTTRERIDATTLAVTPSTQESVSRDLSGTLDFNSSFRYDAGEADRFGGSLGYQRGDRRSTSLARYRDYAPDGMLTNDQWRASTGTDSSSSYNAGVFHGHKFDAEDEDLKLDFRFSSSTNPGTSRSQSIYAATPTSSPQEMSRQWRAASTRIADFSADYTTKLGKSFLTAGIKVVDTRQDYDSLSVGIDPTTGIERIDPVLTNAFSVDEHVLAAYKTWEYRFDERWSVKTGLRAERTQLGIHQITSGIEATNAYTNSMPSALASYKLDRDTALRVAWSHRVQRPNPNDLNPYVVLQSPTDRISGNPRLKPSQSDSYELGYATTWAGVKTDLRLFARNEDDVITQRQVAIKDENGQDVVLTTPLNFGENRSQGIEFVFNGKPTPALTVNISGNLRRMAQTQFAVAGQPGMISDTSLSGRTHLNYQLTPEDQLQFIVFAQGKQLWAQGYRELNWNSDFTWQRKLTPLLTMLVNINDPLNSNRSESRTDSEFLRQTSVTRVDGRIFYIGFRYELGLPGSRRM